MQKNYTLNILLAAVVGLASLAALLCRVFLPAAILPVVSLPAVAALVLIALVLECYLTKRIPQRDWGVTGLLGALTFGLLPFGGRRCLSGADLPVHHAAGAAGLRPCRAAGPAGHRRRPVPGLPVLYRHGAVSRIRFW